MSLPALEFLLNASDTSLQDMELAALNRSANLSKTLKLELDAWIEQTAAAVLTRWMIDNREELLKLRTVDIIPKKSDFFEPRDIKKSA